MRVDNGWEKFAAGVAFALVLLAGAIALRIWLADGEPRCFFSDEPAICAAVTK